MLVASRGTWARLWAFVRNLKGGGGVQGDFRMGRHFIRHAVWRDIALVAALSVFVCRCGTSMQNGRTPADTSPGSTSDAGLAPSDAGVTTGDAGADMGSGADAGQAVFLLNILNYNTGCSITEEGGTYRTLAAFFAGSVVSLDAAALPGYAWGYWTWTDGDTGSGDMNMAATVTMNANKQVVACCPLAPPGAQVCPAPMP